MDECPPWDEVGTPEYTFWAEFSHRLASGSSGVVYYLTPGYYNGTGSFFGLYELPALLAAGSAAKKFVVLNVVEEGQTQCGEGDLNLLYARVQNMRPSLAFECYNVRGNGDNPTEELIHELLKLILTTSEMDAMQYETEKLSAIRDNSKTAGASAALHGENTDVMHGSNRKEDMHLLRFN